MSFRATTDTRTIAEILQHVVQTQKILVGETCREGSNLMRQSFAAHAQEYAPGVEQVTNKQELIELLHSMEAAEACVWTTRTCGTPMNGITGQQPKARS